MKIKYNPKFSVESVLDTLRAVGEKYPDASQEDEALRIAAVSLIYLRDTQKLDDYREFFRKFYTPAIDCVAVSHTFASRAEADTWIATGTPVDGELVSIAGQGFQVIPQRNGQGFRFLRTPLPSELMKKNPDDSE